MVNVARFLEVDPEDALRSTIKKFMRRFRHVERTLQERGVSYKEAGLEQMDTLWNEAKRLESK